MFQWLLSQSINGFDDVKFEAASVLAELYEQQAQSTLSKPILRKAIELSQHSVYWHCRLIFQLAVSIYVLLVILSAFCFGKLVFGKSSIFRFFFSFTKPPKYYPYF